MFSMKSTIFNRKKRRFSADVRVSSSSSSSSSLRPHNPISQFIHIPWNHIVTGIALSGEIPADHNHNVIGAVLCAVWCVVWCVRTIHPL